MEYTYVFALLFAVLACGARAYLSDMDDVRALEDALDERSYGSDADDVDNERGLFENLRDALNKRLEENYDDDVADDESIDVNDERALTGASRDAIQGRELDAETHGYGPEDEDEDEAADVIDRLLAFQAAKRQQGLNSRTPSKRWWGWGDHKGKDGKDDSIKDDGKPKDGKDDSIKDDGKPKDLVFDQKFKNIDGKIKAFGTQLGKHISVPDLKKVIDGLKEQMRLAEEGAEILRQLAEIELDKALDKLNKACPGLKNKKCSKDIDCRCDGHQAMTCITSGIGWFAKSRCED